eukprot:CAMPEP_0178377666 /NCGR_PEP_ID=MMETSP0689_2-20121128/4035_1 /TAXON_ID=160604 /ORGANISM="Amphidinium massartii, Strain CS-259" /LENGTH=782 /DNA_ID=CAMNT_0019997725 /DNA_START=49 /DNA_END=2394 /DNA_ORIENTATION=+
MWPHDLIAGGCGTSPLSSRFLSSWRRHGFDPRLKAVESSWGRGSATKPDPGWRWRVVLAGGVAVSALQPSIGQVRVRQRARRGRGQVGEDGESSGRTYIPKKERRRRKEAKRLRRLMGPMEEPPPPTRATYSGPLILDFKRVSWIPPPPDPVQEVIVDPDEPPQRIKLPRGQRLRGRSILANATWSLEGKERVALVGPNGAGKTVQLKMVLGEIEPTGGRVTRVPIDMRIGYLGQDSAFGMPGATVEEELLSIVTDQLQSGRQASEEDKMRVQHMLEWLGMLELQAKRVCDLSGGWRMRVALGKSLLQGPDLLLLDEPTNHLDQETVSFLEGALKALELPVVVASHDRSFLAAVATKVVEVSAGKTTVFSQGYMEYTRARDSSLAAAWKKFQGYKQQCATLESQIDSLASKMLENQAAKKRDELEALMERPISQPEVDVAPDFTLPAPPPPEDEAVEASDARTAVLSADSLSIAYEGNVVLQNVTFDIYPGEKVAVVGPNGAGKSALLTTLVGDNPSAEISGRLEFKPDSLAYFPQRLAERVAARGGTVRETLALDCGHEDLELVLQKLRLDGSVQHQLLGSLSGGERARVAFAWFLLHPSETLVFDEPTNHLDAVTRELLEGTLKNFPGTALVVSHDMFFLREFATRVLSVADGVVESFDTLEAYAKAVNWNGDALEQPFVDQDAKAHALWSSKRMARIRRKASDADLGLRRLSPKAEGVAKQREQQQSARQRKPSAAVARLLKSGVDPALLGPSFFPEQQKKASRTSKRSKVSPRPSRTK